MLIGNFICAIFIFFAIKPWIGWIPFFLAIAAITLFLTLGMSLHLYGRAFQRNEMAEWIQRYPSGQEVLNEFTRNYETV